MPNATFDRTIVLKATYCAVPGPAVEVDGVAKVTVRWKCRCGKWHEARV